MVPGLRGATKTPQSLGLGVLKVLLQIWTGVWCIGVPLGTAQAALTHNESSSQRVSLSPPSGCWDFWGFLKSAFCLWLAHAWKAPHSGTLPCLVHRLSHWTLLPKPPPLGGTEMGERNGSEQTQEGTAQKGPEHVPRQLTGDTDLSHAAFSWATKLQSFAKLEFQTELFFMTKDELILLFSFFTFLQSGGCKTEPKKKNPTKNQKKGGLDCLLGLLKKCSLVVKSVMWYKTFRNFWCYLFCPVSQGYRDMVPS